MQLFLYRDIGGVYYISIPAYIAFIHKLVVVCSRAGSPIVFGDDT